MRSAGNIPAARFAVGFGISQAIAVLLNSLLVILKESNAGIKTWMKGLTGHHWMTHAVILLATYCALGVILSNSRAARKISGGTLLAVYVASVITGCLAIVA
ncbi:MAG: hypothetical protein Q7T82_13560 [Armatimonadota bacterium]|nr:hypothetical protein [Armatimonadota bacterium]